MNFTGRILTMMTWGESHGEAIGCVLDGVPAGIPLQEDHIQPFLDERKPASSRHVTQRKEADRVTILSGVYRDHTTAAPIMMMIANTDARSKDYDAIKNSYRPGHADMTYDIKYGGYHDPRGSGRASARETAARVAAGAVARRIMNQVTIEGALIQLGTLTIDRNHADWRTARGNPLFCPQPDMLPSWEQLLDDTRKDGNSIGGVAEIHASGVPAGWGEPVYGKLDALLAAAIMSIPAVKSVEIGAGIQSAAMTGDQYADVMKPHKNAIQFASNNNGGILGGISTGQNIVVRYAVKPTSSIRKTLDTVTRAGKATTIQTKGRHDPCVAIRSVPIAEAMMALTLADAMLLHRARKGDAP